MIGSAQSAHLVNSVILTCHTACLAPPNVTILRMYISSESHFLPPAKRLALRMSQWVRVCLSLDSNTSALNLVVDGEERYNDILNFGSTPENLNLELG